jgi:hypothetical protein
MVISVITGASLTVTNGLKKNLEAKPGKYSTDSQQTTAILGTSHTIRRVLQAKLKSARWGSPLVQRSTKKRDLLEEKTTT